MHTFCGLEDDAVEPFISLSKTLRLLYRSSKLRLSTPGLVLIIKETCDQAEGRWIRIFKKRNKKKAKTNKAKHGKERTKSSRSLKS
ncbi:hypothetical protein Tco_0406530, partial [Tanacetum coccineum]